MNFLSVLIAPRGYQPCGLWRGEQMDIEEVFLKAGHVASGEVTLEELAEMSENAIKGPGVCQGMGTANSMHISCEALGMTLPGTTPVRANSPAMWEAVRRAGARIVGLIAEGGTPAVLKQLGGLLRPDARSADGRTVGEIAAAATVRDSDVIRPADSPFASHPTIVVLRGSLAPEGAVVKLAVDDTRPHQFRGPARVYSSRDAGLAGLRNNEIQPGEVVLLAGIGLRGGPGMGLTSAFIFALDGAGLGGKCAVVTDGPMSGLVNKGIVVGEVSPEAATGGPLGLVRDGDIISIDLDRRVIDLELPEGELDRRRAAFTAPAPSGDNGWLGVYERTVGPLSQGATLRG